MLRLLVLAGAHGIALKRVNAESTGNLGRVVATNYQGISESKYQGKRQVKSRVPWMVVTIPVANTKGNQIWGQKYGCGKWEEKQ